MPVRHLEGADLTQCRRCGEASTVLAGLGAQPNGSTLDTTLFHFGGEPLQLFNDTVFKGNTGCSPNSPSDYMTIDSMVRCSLLPLSNP